MNFILDGTRIILLENKNALVIPNGNHIENSFKNFHVKAKFEGADYSQTGLPFERSGPTYSVSENPR